MTAFTKPAPAPACTADRDGFAVLGMTRHARMGIRYSNGEGGAAPAAAPAGQAADAAAAAAAAPAHPGAGTPAAGAAPAAAAATPPAAAATPDANGKIPDAQQPPVGGVPFAELPAETQAEVRRLRADDAKWRQQLATGMTDETRQTLGKALGFIDDTPTPEALAKGLGEVTTRAEAAESRATAAERANMVLLTAPDANANASLLLDSKGFAAKIEGLDPTDSAGIKAAIEAWVKDNPAHALGPVRPGLPATSGPRQQGSPQTPAKPGLEGAVAAAMGQQPQRS